MAKFTVRYGIDDGFITGRREKTFEIDSEALWDMERDSDLDDLFHEAIYDHFSENVQPTPINFQEFLEWAHKQSSCRTREDEE